MTTLRLIRNDIKHELKMALNIENQTACEDWNFPLVIFTGDEVSSTKIAHKIVRPGACSSQWVREREIYA